MKIYILRHGQDDDSVRGGWSSVPLMETGIKQAYVLAGMDKKFPNLFWRNLDWEEHYPQGESPKEFYERVCNGWYNFTESLANYDKNVLLITHGGVINIIRCIINSESYSNRVRYQGAPYAKICFEVNLDTVLAVGEL